MGGWGRGFEPESSIYSFTEGKRVIVGVFFFFFGLGGANNKVKS